MRLFKMVALSGLIAVVPLATCWAQTVDTASIASPEMMQDLSVSTMFRSADIVVKAVMLGLMAASVATWTILLAKGIATLQARRQLAHDLRRAEPICSLAELQLQLPRGQDAQAITVMTAAAAAEITMSDGSDAHGVKERVESRLRRIEAGFGRRMAHGTGLLATIGATAPFVGLFGTVWGIMNSFIGIARLHTTNLSVVAPGIAEALLATACGLIAAIPAVVIYNLFARGIVGYRAALADLSACIQRLVSRDLDRRKLPHSLAAE